MKSDRLFSRDFTLMVIGQIISLLGNAVLRFALPLQVLDATGSAAAFGGVLALSMVPVLLCSPLGGVLADRVPRQRIMWGLDFSTAALAAGYGLLFARGHSVAAVGGMMVLLSAIQALYQPAVQASIPVLAAEEHLPAANGVVAQVQALSSLLGPILGGMLYGWVGLAPIVWVGAACFFGSAVMELFLHIPFHRQERGGAPLAAVGRDLRDAGVFLVKEQPGLLRVLALIALINLFLSALFIVGLPYLIKITLGLSSQLYSFAEAALSLGSILGGLLSGAALGRTGLRGAWRFLLGTVLSLLPIALALVLGLPPLAAYGVILAAVLAGMACAMLFSVAAQTYLQRATPPQLLGKAAALVSAISTCAMPLGRPCTACCSRASRPAPGRWCSWGWGPVWRWPWPPFRPSEGSPNLTGAQAAGILRRV